MRLFLLNSLSFSLSLSLSLSPSFSRHFRKNGILEIMIPGSILRRIARARILSSYNAIHFEHEIPGTRPFGAHGTRRPARIALSEIFRDCPFVRMIPVHVHVARSGVRTCDCSRRHA